jgi:hypothetical protein
MIGVPVRSAGDASAAVEMILECGRSCMIDLGEEGSYGGVAKSLLHALRDFFSVKVE